MPNFALFYSVTCCATFPNSDKDLEVDNGDTGQKQVPLPRESLKLV